VWKSFSLLENGKVPRKGPLGWVLGGLERRVVGSIGFRGVHSRQVPTTVGWFPGFRGSFGGIFWL